VSECLSHLWSAVQRECHNHDELFGIFHGKQTHEFQRITVYLFFRLLDGTLLVNCLVYDDWKNL